MQIKTGTVNATNGSNQIYATSASGADWTQVTSGSLFVVTGRRQLYFINSVSYNSGLARWEAILSVNYGEATITDSAYAIVRDFTFNYNLPMLASGDVETATIFTRAMQLIDAALRQAALSGGSGGDDPTPYTKIAHGFVVGSALRLDASGIFQLATSASEANSRIVGVVSEVVDSDNFLLQTDGLLVGIGTPLTPGTTYWLKNTASAFNLTSNIVTETTLKVPVLVAVGASEGILLGMAQASASPMTGAGPSTAGTGGMVPAPVAGDNVKFLRGDGLWASALPSAGSIEYQMLKATPAFTTADWNAIPANASPAMMLKNLHDRMRSVEGQSSDYTHTALFTYQDTWALPPYTVNTRGNITPVPGAYPIFGLYNWVAPAGLLGESVRAILIGGGGAGGGWIGNTGSLRIGGGGGSGEYREVLLPITPGDTYVIQVAKGGDYIGGFYNMPNQVAPSGGNSYIQDTASNFLAVAKGGTNGWLSVLTDDTPGTGGTGGSQLGDPILVRPGRDGGKGILNGTPFRCNGVAAQVPPYADFLSAYGSGAPSGRAGTPGVVFLFWKE